MCSHTAFQSPPLATRSHPHTWPLCKGTFCPTSLWGLGRTCLSLVSLSLGLPQPGWPAESGCPSVFWAVLRVQLGSGELRLKSLVPWKAWCKTRSISHISWLILARIAPKTVLFLSRRLGGPISAEGLEPFARVWVYRHGLRCPRLHTRRFGGGTGTFSPSHVPCKSDCWLCCLSPALYQPPKHFRILLRAAARMISTTLMWSLFFLHLGPTFRNPALCNAVGIE